MKKSLAILALALTFNLSAVENTMNTSGVGEFVWNELATTNVQGSKDFYNKVFGWEFIDKKTDGMTYTIIKKDGKEFGGIWAIPAEQQSFIPTHWLAYILVQNLEQSLDTARQNGATIIKSIQKVDQMGLFAVIRDPSGAHLALWQNLRP